LQDDLKQAIGAAYKAITNANATIDAHATKARTESAMQGVVMAAATPIADAISSVRAVL
jgi:hypothetical protein